VIDLAVNEIAVGGWFEPQTGKSSRLLKSKSLFTDEGDWGTQL
jgi:hypothetical protein